MSSTSSCDDTLPPDAFDSSSVSSLPIAFTAVFLPFVLGFVALRFYSRRRSARSWGWDDVLVGIAAIGQIGLATISFDIAVNGGSGYHIDYLAVNQPQKTSRFAMDVFALQLVYYVFINAPKLAVLVLYQHIFSVQTYALLVTRILMGVLILYTLISVLLTIFSCGRHVDLFWDLNGRPAGTCIDIDSMQIYTSVPNVVIDVLILIIPLPVLWRLRVRMSVKVGIALTFLIGSLGLVFAAVRFYVVYHINYFSDQTYVSAELVVWSELEPGCYIICACLLVMRPLFERLADSSLIRSFRS